MKAISPFIHEAASFCMFLLMLFYLLQIFFMNEQESHTNTYVLQGSLVKLIKNSEAYP